MAFADNTDVKIGDVWLAVCGNAHLNSIVIEINYSTEHGWKYKVWNEMQYPVDYITRVQLLKKIGYISVLNMIIEKKDNW